jgi:anti-sigma B factor antagonist
VGCADKTVWVKVEGKGSFQNSPGLKDFAAEMIHRGSRRFVVDLGGCPVMDSTFMGTLAGIALRLRELGQGGLAVVRLNDRNRELVQNLGLNQLFTVEAPVGDAGPHLGDALDQGTVDRKAQATTMIEAHEALVQADAANVTKFKDVLEYLRQDLRGCD